MKKLLFYLISALLALICLSSCSTTVRVAYDNPSEIDMGQYRTIAIASTVDFAGFQSPSYYVRSVDTQAALRSRVRSSYSSALASDMASYATASLVDSLYDTGFFTIIPPSITDGLIARNNLGISNADDIEAYGIDAFIIPRIVSMDVDEYVSSEGYWVTDYTRKDKNGNPERRREYRYYITQSASMVYSYTIVDAKTMTIYQSRNFSNKVGNTTEITSYGFAVPRIERYFEGLIDAFTTVAASQLAPQRSYLYVDLMDNKPKAESVKSAYDLVEDGYSEEARNLFYKEWISSGHLPSGYNYALLTAALGDVDGAIETLKTIQRSYSSSDVDYLLSRLQEVKSRNAAAQAQYEGTGTVYSNYDDSSVFTVIMGQ